MLIFPKMVNTTLTYLLINIFQQPITTSKEIHVIKTSMDDKSNEAINSIIEHKYGTMKKDNEEQV